MTEAHTGREDVTTDGDDAITVPSPPPPPVQEEDKDYVDPVFAGMVQKLWDLVLVYGPATRAELHPYRPVISHNWREYLRYHSAISRTHKPSQSELLTADRWVFDRAIDHSLERGWLTQDADDKIFVAALPPSHRPLGTMGGESDVRSRMLGMTEGTARRILESKLATARMKPTRAGKNRLRKSIQAHGLLSPIVIWEIPGGHITIDGVTRTEVCAELGIDLDLDNPRHFRKLPRETTATDALFQRIQFEVAATSKDQSDEARNEYIAQLAADGWKQADIAKEVELSTQRVGQILSRVKEHFQVGQKVPSDSDVTEFIALSNAGWTVRDIAERTQWTKSTIQRALTRPDAPAPEDVPASKEPSPKKMVVIRALHELGEATEKEILDHAGVTTRTGTMFAELRNKDGWIRITSGMLKSRSNPVRYVLTDKAKIDLAPFLGEPTPEPALATVIELPRRPEPAPEPESTPAPTPHTPRKTRAKSLDVTMAQIDKFITGKGLTRAQVIVYWAEHPDA